MEKIINKNIIIGFIIGLIVMGGIGVGATTLYNSIQISYEETNVFNALNDLYAMKTELNTIKGLGDAAPENISVGKTAVVKGQLVTGTSGGNNLKLVKVLLGTSTGNYDLTSYEGYDKFTDDNFSLEITSATGSIWYSGRADSGSVKNGTLSFNKIYDSSTGKLSVSKSGNTTLYVTEYGKANSDATYNANFKVYLYYVQ